LKLAGYRLTGTFRGSKFGIDGTLSFAATLIQNGETRLINGTFQLADGGEVSFSGVPDEPDRESHAEQEADDDKESDDDSDIGGKQKSNKKSSDPKLTVAVNYPLGAFGFEQLPKQEHVALTNATIWTCGAEGVLEDATVLIESGRIVAVGKNVELPDGVSEIDCAGRHITPGIIDCHSHAASDGGMNEMGDAITAEVRIADFVDPDDITIYHWTKRPLASNSRSAKTSNVTTGRGTRGATLNRGWGSTS
jgi:hypothetical protein